MNITTIVNKYLKEGNDIHNSQVLAAEEIIIKKIAASKVSNIITIKGGMIMYNLSHSQRRVTEDIDFDLIRYSIDNNSIISLVNKLNNVNDGISVAIIGELEELKHQDYHGRHVQLLLKDSKRRVLTMDLDMGVHTYHAIEQNVMVFEFSENSSTSLKTNPCEQVFSEKLISLARRGEGSTRYKDVYDLYYLISSGLVEIKRVREIMELFFTCSKLKPNNMADAVMAVEKAFDNETFKSGALKPANAWLDVDYETMKKTILDYIYKL